MIKRNFGGGFDYMMATSKELMGHFGFPLSYPKPVPANVRAIKAKLEEGKSPHHPMDFQRVLASRELALSDEELWAYEMWQMEGYIEKFDGGRGESGPTCRDCNGEIILPIDLRRWSGVDYHGACFPKAITRHLVDGSAHYSVLSRDSSSFYNLELLLRRARVTHPADFTWDESTPILTRDTLNLHEIQDRADLESVYWTGSKSPKTPQRTLDPHLPGLL